MSVHLFLGDDQYGLTEAIRALEEATIAPGWPQPEPPASWQDAVEALATPAFFGGRVIRYHLAKAEADEFLEGIAQELPLRAAEGNVLLIVAEGVDKRKKGYKEIAKLANIQQFDLPKPWEADKVMLPRARQMLERQGGTAEPAALDYVVDAVGVDSMRLQSEIEKLVTAAGGGRITLNMAKALVSHKDGDLFGLLGALAKGDKGAALLEVDRLLLLDPAYKIIPGLASNLRTIMHLLRLNEERAPDAAQRLGLNPFRAKILLGEWRRRRWRDLEKALAELLLADVRLKSTRAEPKLLLETWVAGFPG